MLIDKICGFDLYDDIEDIKRIYPPQKITNRGIDYTNVRYEKLIYKYKTESINKHTQWVAQCDCGLFFKNRPKQNKMCPYCRYKIIKPGTRFQHLTVLKRIGTDNSNSKYLCKCDCGNEIEIYGNNLTRKNTTSCGCKKFLHQDPYKNIIGNIYGRLTVKEIAYNKNNTYYYKCLCSCGNTTVVSSDNLKRGNTSSCGCYQRERHSEVNKKDITGLRSGKLTALEDAGYATPGGRIWKCKCDCGNISYVKAASIIGQTIKSCGCLISWQASQIDITLNKIYNNIKKEITFEGCRNPKTNYKLRFDFAIYNESNQLLFVIEFDGSQHFYYQSSSTTWNNKENFEQIRARDLIKNKYCFDNNIPLIRIPYDADYTIDDLKLGTTRFLLTPENEKEYYESRAN